MSEMKEGEKEGEGGRHAWRTVPFKNAIRIIARRRREGIPLFIPSLFPFDPSYFSTSPFAARPPPPLISVDLLRFLFIPEQRVPVLALIC